MGRAFQMTGSVIRSTTSMITVCYSTSSSSAVFSLSANVCILDSKAGHQMSRFLNNKENNTPLTNSMLSIKQATKSSKSKIMLLMNLSENYLLYAYCINIRFVEK